MSEKKTSGGFIQRFVVLACVAIVGLALLGGIGYGLWRAVCVVEHGMLALWALLATASLPIVAVGAHKLGHMESKGKIAGLDLGLAAAINAGKAIADVKINASRALRQDPPQMPEVRLPEIIEVRPQLRSGREVIDL